MIAEQEKTLQMSGFKLNNSMFMRPKHLLPSAWTGHLPFAAWVVEEHAPANVVELGTHHGTSYLGFCQAIVENGLVANCFAVDTWQGDEQAGLYGEEVYERLSRINHENYGGFSQLLRMQFDDALGYFKDGSIDLLHIDGLHTYEAVRHDFEQWRPKLSRRGVVLFHDTMVREREFGVWRLWAELREEYRGFEFQHSHGLGVLLVGDQYGDGLERLVRLSPEEGAHALRLFDSLAARIFSIAQQTQADMDRVEAVGQAALREEIEKSNLHLQDAYIRLGEADAFARTQSAHVEHLNNELRSVQQAIVELEKINQSLLLEVGKRDVELAEAKALAAMNHAESRRWEQAIESLLGEAERLSSDFSVAIDSRWKKFESALDGQRASLDRSAEILMRNEVAEGRRWAKLQTLLGTETQRLNDVMNGVQWETADGFRRVESVCRELHGIVFHLVETEQLRASLKDCEAWLAAKDVELVEMEHKVHELEGELQSIKASLIWRSTALLRLFPSKRKGKI